MKLTILDFAVIAVPLVIALIARFSRPREISRQSDQVTEARKPLLKAHIKTIQAKANRNLIPVNTPRGVRRRDPVGVPIRVR